MFLFYFWGVIVFTPLLLYYLTMLRTLENEQIELVLRLFNLVESVASKYELKNGFEVGVRGMVRGLEAYKKNDRQKDHKLDTYLAWWIKSAIEHQLGWENEDTIAYGKNL